MHSGGGGSADNLITTYASEGAVILAPFIGKKAGGTWSLHVADLAGQDVGKVNRWRVVATL